MITCATVSLLAVIAKYVKAVGLAGSSTGQSLGSRLSSRLQAVKLTSSRTQLPYEYYSLPFCQPSKITYKAENLGKSLPPSACLPRRGAQHTCQQHSS